jgi:peroxiredoxin
MTLKGIVRHVVSSALGGTKAMLQVGDVAPEFEVQDHRGRTVRLADLRGRKVVLWFYPKADTPG